MQLRSSLASRCTLLLALVLLLPIGGLALSGCGQKGPLTLAKPPAGAASAPSK